MQKLSFLQIVNHLSHNIFQNNYNMIFCTTSRTLNSNTRCHFEYLAIHKMMSFCFVFKVIRIWKDEDIHLDKAFKATVSVNMLIQLSSLLALKAMLCFK